MSPTKAADMVLKTPAASRSFNWTGFYVGANIGYAADHGSPERSLVAPACKGPACPALVSLVSATPKHINASGFTGGGQVGYNYQIGNVVVGIEADINALRLHGSANFGPALVSSGFPARVASVDSTTSDWLFTFRPRIGFAVGGFLPYVTGGLAATDEKYSSTLDVTTGGAAVIRGTFNSSASRNVGWALGGGLEYAFAQGWSVKAEYLRLDFGTVTGATIVAGGVGGVAGSTLAFSNRFGADVARAGINYRLSPTL